MVGTSPPYGTQYKEHVLVQHPVPLNLDPKFHFPTFRVEEDLTQEASKAHEEGNYGVMCRMPRILRAIIRGMGSSIRIYTTCTRSLHHNSCLVIALELSLGSFPPWFLASLVVSSLQRMSP